MIPSVKIPARRTLVRRFIALISIVANCPSQQASSGPPLASQQPPPYWAFTVDPPNAPPEATGNAPQHVPNSSQSYTLAQIADLFSVPDWHPNRIPRCQILSPTDKSPTCTPAPTVTCRTARGVRKTPVSPVFQPTTSRSKWRPSNLGHARPPNPNSCR